MSDKLKHLRHYYLGILLGKNYRVKYWKENDGKFIWGLRQCIIDTKDEPSRPSISPITKEQFENMFNEAYKLQNENIYRK